MQVIPNMFRSPGEEGDFGWMITQSEYDDALFVFNDNQEQFLDYLKDATPGSSGCAAGMNNAAIRPYQCADPPRAAGVPTGSHGVGYSETDAPGQTRHRRRVRRHQGEVRASGSYQRIYYSAANAEGDLGTGVFKVGDDVKKYIVQELRKLAD